ncbi:MAG: hypothetical protein NZM09_03185 [Ignavibacterium sp.]|nr:hypothetical protein [Ignavibacterium sp.]MCX7612294.1 hypothetical protein [Ignavibacterium sp.]MDW8374682.1 hypothetical protein [Ignavibacteriales bacterium]
MNKKLRSTLILLGFLILIIGLSLGYYSFILGKELKEKEKKLKELSAKIIDETELNMRLESLKRKSAEIDSILANKRFFVFSDMSPVSFFEFSNKLVRSFSTESQFNVEYIDQKSEGEFQTYNYKVSGFGFFDEVFGFIRSIEKSKSLKKIKSITVGNIVNVDKKGVPIYYTSFDMEVKSYFTSNKNFSPTIPIKDSIDNLKIYNFLFPLIRTEIPPNIYELLDVQDAKLLALLPDGAFISDNKGNTYLLSEGEEVYLGYLTKIDYKNNMVSFVLNKGGIIEKINLYLETNDQSKNKKEK